MTNKIISIARRQTVTVAALAGALVIGGCAYMPGTQTPPAPPPIPKAGPPVPAGNKVVLASNTQLVANTAAGRIRIEAGPGLRRVFDWDGQRRGAIIKPRAKPFAGGKSKGITFDGTPTVWAPANGITRLRYEEGWRNFATIEDAIVWMQIRRLYFTYNDQGLVVGWKHKGDTLHVELWQFTIHGKKPTSLPGSNDSQIAEGPLEIVPETAGSASVSSQTGGSQTSPSNS